MPILHSFLQAVFLFVRSFAVRVSKHQHRSSAVLMTGTAVVAVVAFSAAGFGGGGKNALAAAAPPKSGEEAVKEEPTEEEISRITEAKIQFGLAETGSPGQLLSGQLLVRDIREREQKEEEARAQIEARRQELLKEKQEEAARREAEEARRRAQEEERLRRESRRIPYSDEDYQVLLRIVQAEAGICDDRGKILVANVIINRVLSDEFPDSIKAVVYEPSQFQPVMNGSIHSVKVTADTVRCVERALDGEDYSQGALYFMNRGVSGGNASWFDRHLEYLFAHDGHEFFK